MLPKNASVFLIGKSSVVFYSYVLKAFFLLFIFTNALLFYFIYDRDNSHCLNGGTCNLNKRQRTLPREKWGQTVFFSQLIKNFVRVNNEWRLAPASNRTSKAESLRKAELNCSTLQNVNDFHFVASGYTKSTFKIKVSNTFLSVKIVNVGGHDVTSCLLQEDRFLYDCFLLSASKLLREIAILESISHQNIAKILGYCIPLLPDANNPHNTVAIFEEYGQPIDVIKLLQLSWEDRLRISLGLTRLLQYLSSFRETIALNDFRREQFVLIDGELKLIDLDDVGLREPHCVEKPCCSSNLSVHSEMLCIPCVDGTCYGFNEKMNIIRTGGHFIRHILPHGAPPQLRPLADRITAAFGLGAWSAMEFSEQMEKLTFLFKNGSYRPAELHFLKGFKKENHMDISSNFDYRCPLATTGYGCAMSVYNAEEAAEICSRDSSCKAFVMTGITTWTGRTIAQFKRGTGSLLPNNSTVVYVKS